MRSSLLPASSNVANSPVELENASDNDHHLDHHLSETGWDGLRFPQTLVPVFAHSPTENFSSWQFPSKLSPVEPVFDAT
jgi:hypothetical protein